MHLAALLLLTFFPQETPPPVAIENTTAVVSPGTEIKNATIVLRNGLIHSVGTEGDVPADAKVIDGKGLVVYAGFIDSYTTLGQKKDSKSDSVSFEGRDPDFTRQPLLGMQDANRKGVRPSYTIAPRLKLSEEVLSSWRKAGFTSVLSAPEGAYLSGQSALFSLSGAPLRECLILPNGPMQGSFSASGKGYPGTLMGMFAHVRQLFHDARAYGESRNLYRAAPRGKIRPPYDPTLEAMQDILNRKTSVLFRANSENEIRRAVRLSKELGFQLMIAGGGSSWKAVDVLKGIPVFLTLDLPEEPKEDEDKPKRLLEEEKQNWKDRVGCAASLEAAGVPFVFTTVGSSPGEALESIHKLKLSHDVALRALTVTPAKLFGMTEMGRIRPGMMAHLTILSGRLGEEKTQVRYVISDGWLSEFPARKKGEGKAEVDVTGIWKGSTGSFEWTMDLKQSGTGITGTINSRYGEMKVTGDVEGTSVTITGSMEGSEISIEASIKKGKMTGTLTSPFGSNPFTARKPEKNND